MSQRSYKRLSLKEREEISRSLAQGISFRNIAGLLERDVSTISREINRASMNKKGFRIISPSLSIIITFVPFVIWYFLRISAGITT